MNNPGFPHTCRVFKCEGEDAWTDGMEKVLYEGECMNECSSSKRTFKESGVIKGDYAVYIPILVKGLCPGCRLDVTDYTGTYRNMVISDASPSPMGTTIYYNLPKN